MDSDYISNNNHSQNITRRCFGANTARKGLNMAAILKFKMGAEDTLEKNESKSGSKKMKANQVVLTRV